MRKHDFQYFFHEGVSNMFSHGFMSFAAVGITVACLLIMGTFSLVAWNANALLEDLERENEILAYVDDTYTESQAKALESKLEKVPNVASATFISRQQAMEDFAADYPDQEMFQDLDPRILRDRYTIRVAEQYAKKPHKRATILNINAPCVEPSELKEPVYEPLDTAFYLDSYEERTSPRAGDYYWLESGAPIEPADEGSDNWYLERGHITLTIMGNYTCEPRADWDALGID